MRKSMVFVNLVEGMMALRELKIDEKWSFHITDKGEHEPPKITRYGQPAGGGEVNNVELAMAYRIMELEDELKEMKTND